MKLRHAAGFKPPCRIRQDARHSNARISVQWFSMAPRSIEEEARDLSTASQALYRLGDENSDQNSREAT
jgi:hypothetical protein